MKGLKQKRKERKMTLAELGKILGYGQCAISTWERGERFPRKAALDKLCAFFNCKVDDLL